MQKFIFLFISFFYLNTIAFSGSNLDKIKPKPFVLQNGETLIYEVRWLSIKIGEIKIVVNRNNLSNIYRAEAYINSADGLPFANVHAVIKSVFSDQISPLSSTSWEKESENLWSVMEYEYDNPKTRAVIKRGSSPAIETEFVRFHKSDTLVVNQTIQDGFSIFFFARRNLGSNETLSVRTLVQGETGNALMRFYNKQTEARIKVVDFPIDVVEFDGIAKFKGIFGLTGDFKGWFSNDEARVPIRAQLGVILGNVDIELIQWERDGWNPPNAR